MTKSMEKQVYEFIATQTGEKIVERKKCKWCGEEFAITDKDLEFYSKISPVFNGTKYEIPAPTLCPDCRFQKKMLWKNERKLYKTVCDATNQNIISIYSPDSIYKVYDQKYRWSDKRNPMDYGRKYNFSQTFFEQFDELLRFIPHSSLNNSISENSLYCNDCRSNKNCYFVFASDQNQDSQYLWNSRKLDFSLDCNNTDQWTHCCQCCDSADIFQCFYCNDCFSCSECYFCFWCEDCQNCFLCTDLKNQQYCISNTQYSKDEYHNKIKDFYLWNYKNLQNLIQKSKQILSQRIYRNLRQINCDNVFSNYAFDSQKSSYSFQIEKSSDVKYVMYSAELSNSYDIYLSGWTGEKLYEVVWCWGNSYSVLFSIECRDCTDVLYSKNCYNSSNLFGCVWLRDKQYCILNKQYTQKEYEQLVPQIIEQMKTNVQWWEFFPVEISTFVYQETIASEHFPISRDDAVKKWFKRQDKEYPINIPEWIELINAKDLPDNIHDITDEILNKAIICEVSGKPFRIIKPELDFYRKHTLALPRKHPDIRHLDRIKSGAPRPLYLRNCDNCGKQVISVYPADSEFKVYCEECYNKEIY